MAKTEKGGVTIFLIDLKKLKGCPILNFHTIKGSLVSSIGFGPFDNGYLLLGFTDGNLLALDAKSFATIFSY